MSLTIPNKEDTLKAMRKQESVFTSTGCANMLKKDIIDSRAKELGNTKVNNKLYELKKLGIGSQLLERMRWEGGVLGKFGQGILLPIELNTRPNNILTTNVIASQELFEKNEEEDEALSRPLRKKKTKHVTNPLRATLHFCKETAAMLNNKRTGIMACDSSFLSAWSRMHRGKRDMILRREVACMHIHLGRKRVNNQVSTMIIHRMKSVAID
nr:hypothetical protein [Tanacetum cinerariifolium]